MPPLPAEHERALALALRALGRRAAGPPLPVPHSLLNANYRVPTPAGDLFLRLSPASRGERVLLEQRVAAFAAARGIPTPLPLADPSGGTCWQSGSLVASAYPWVAGRLLVAGAISTREAALLGRLQARLHEALAGFPGLDAASTQLTWDTDQSVGALSRIDDLIRYYPAPGEERLAVQRGLRLQLALLEGTAPRPPGDFAYLALQPCHGDFHERNILFGADGDPLAVVDWELVALLPPGYDVLRSLSYMGLLEDELATAYLRAYRDVRRLGGEEWVAAVECWWQHLLHSTWAARHVFIEGDERAAPFVGSHAALVARFSDEGFRARLAGA